jgi:hypothetical protein
VKSAILDLGPAELAMLQALGHQTDTRAVTEDEFDPTHPLGAEHVDSP